MDKLVLEPGAGEETSTAHAQGASILEYEWTIPSKFMVGTQQGGCDNTRWRIEASLKLCRQCVFLQQKEPWQGQDWPDLPSSLWCCLCITEEPFFSEGKKLFQSFKSLFVIPFQHFLTVGDWSAKVWSEDIKGSPIMWTRKIGTKSPTSYQLTFPALLQLCSAIMSLSPTYIH